LRALAASGLQALRVFVVDQDNLKNTLEFAGRLQILAVQPLNLRE
jgi:hypothetical protein